MARGRAVQAGRRARDAGGQRHAAARRGTGPAPLCAASLLRLLRPSPVNAFSDTSSSSSVGLLRLLGRLPASSLAPSRMVALARSVRSRLSVPAGGQQARTSVRLHATAAAAAARRAGAEVARRRLLPPAAAVRQPAAGSPGLPAGPTCQLVVVQVGDAQGGEGLGQQPGGGQRAPEVVVAQAAREQQGMVRG